MALREILAKFGFDVDDSKLKAGKKGLDAFATSIKTLAEKLVGGDIGAWVKDTISDLKDQGAALRATSIQLGIGAQELQKWQVGAKMAGVETTQLNAGLRFLQKNAAGAAHNANDTAQAFVDSGDGALEAALSGKEAAEQFKALGVDVKDSIGKLKDTTQLFRETGLAIAKIPIPAERTAIAMKLLGRQGTALAPLFAQGGEALDKYLATLEQMGGGLSDEAIAALKKYGSESKKADLAILSLKAGIVTQLLPSLTAKTKAMAGAVGWMSKLVAGTNALRATALIVGGALIWLGRAAIWSGIKAAASWALPVLAIAALILLVDDLWSLFSGGDSLIGKAFSKLTGRELGKGFIANQLREDWKGLLSEIDRTPGVWGKATAVFGTIGSSLVRFFANDLPEAYGIFRSSLNNSDVSTAFFDLFTVPIDTLIQFFTSTIPEAASFLWKDIKKGAAGIGEWFVSVGKSIVDGIIGGIKSGIGAAGDAIASLGKGMVDIFKQQFGIKSPSSVMYDAMGYVTQGATDRLEDDRGRVSKAMAGTFQVPVPGASNVGGARSFQVQNNVNNVINASPGDIGTRDAVRQGTSAGLGDLSADLAGLEALA